MGRKGVPVKTKEGAQEIKARALGLAPRIRTALLLVDGVKSVVELERLMAAAGVTAGALQLLLDKGLIRIEEDALENSGGEVTQQDVGLHSFAPTVITSVKPGDNAVAAYPSLLDPLAVKDLRIVAPGRTNAVQSNVRSLESAKKAVASVAVANLVDLETILGDVTKMEMKTILGVATKLELTPTQMLAPNTVLKALQTELQRLPPLVQAQQLARAASIIQKQVMPAAVLRMNLLVARAHLANALDEHVEMDGYALKQKVVACESRVELEQFFIVVESALMRKIEKHAAIRLMGIAQALLER